MLCHIYSEEKEKCCFLVNLKYLLKSEILLGADFASKRILSEKDMVSLTDCSLLRSLPRPDGGCLTFLSCR